MDNQQQQRINEAAEQFTDALAAAYKAGSDRTVAAQDVGAQLTGHFFNSVINNLRTQAQGTRQVTQRLAEQQRRAQEATRQYAQVPTSTYMDFLNSIFSFYRGGTSRTKMRIEEAERRAEQAEKCAEEAERSTWDAEGRAKDAEERAEDAERRAEEAEKRAEEAERNFEEAERRAAETERNTKEVQRQIEKAEERAGRG
jgi:methyl-accepting chemotaxis protein